VQLSYVLPIRCDGSGHEHAELAAYLSRTASIAEVVVIDGSPEAVFRDHAAAFPDRIRHLAPHPDLAFANGKVNGVTTGVREAMHELVVIADDDVRYEEAELRAVAELLRTSDLVVPQNVLDPDTWHALWDTARTLLNRATHTDYPGTLGIRRSSFLSVGGYDGDVLFENLELMRTITAAGGRVRRAPEIIVRRLAPTLEVFLDQRVRQAYDDLAQPVRLMLSLSVLPLVGAAVHRRAWRGIGAAAAGLTLLAEVGRRRAGGRRAFSARAPLFAPAWVLERAVCSWVALGARVIHGGARYRGRRLRRAATPLRVLRRRLGQSARRAAAGAAWEPSQSGFVAERPQRQRATTRRRTTRSHPDSSRMRIGPRTR